jgi:mannose-6-phosphate isomerase-like protein (cupin superfamily)
VKQSFTANRAAQPRSCRGDNRKHMTRILFSATVAIFALAILASAQARIPSTATKPFVIKTKQEVADIDKALEKQGGNKNLDVVPAAGVQMRVAIFHDEKREGDQFEVHDSSDDIYYVLEGDATLALGGSLTEAKEISPGEWRSKTAAGTKNVPIRKGDLIVVPRGTVHQRTVTGKGFSMILIKVFAETAKP